MCLWICLDVHSDFWYWNSWKQLSLQISDQAGIGDDMSSLFLREDDILSEESRQNSNLSALSRKTLFGDLSVNSQLMELHLTSALNLPRNAKLFPANRDKVGGFIFKSLAKSGLMVTSEEFKFEIVTVDDNPQTVYKVCTYLLSRYLLTIWSRHWAGMTWAVFSSRRRYFV